MSGNLYVPPMMQKLGLKVITAISPSFGVRQLDCEGISRIPEEVNEICEH